ncbi:peptidase M23 [Scytonema hofmannii PCC 7110]|uniref:Peptidase M23 n=1 Tax=Scytonema hofmannii PCC 7110 TaxID=128403 RepID=A0A139X5L0_9CYAN|nr:M23 family metallopeptidase [Scytonema hofmannii]KYC39965.1 peptidase M23 [Scytonema hofmannii PCC 7110]
MTQRNNSAFDRWNKPEERPLSKKRFASTLPAQSLSLLGSLGILSSGGLVFAQTESAVDNLVPTVETQQTAPNPVRRSTSGQNSSAPAPETYREQPEFSQRRARLKQRLSRSKSSNPTVVIRQSRPQEVSKPGISVRKLRPEVEISVPTATARKLRTRLRTPRIAPAITREEKLQVETSRSRVSVAGDEKPQQEGSQQSYSSAPGVQSTDKDYNNTYIDPTNYSADTTERYEAPNSVVITERSADRASVANASKERTSTPSWLRRSQRATLATVPPLQRSTTRANRSFVRNTPRVTSGIVSNNFLRNSSRIASASVPQSTIRRHRFIPNDFTPSTTVSSTPIAPHGGTLLPPVTAENIAPRESTVVYDIPLAITLPQIAYSGVYAGRVPYNGSGLMFPLSIPAPITSLFGWRTHPITGDRRFHAGTDLGAAMGTPVVAAQSGLVEIADYMGGYGLTVVLNHSNAQQTLYGHMSQLLVQPGQRVEQGTVIGRVGSTGNSTGPHLHFEVRQLTPQGWVATNPGAQLEYALGQLVQSLQTAQVTRQPGS